ncbi:hypothetical protein QE152_g23613 [Popillia japonica]|uniref:Reverse transcriptase domain-containing protein n=1 Tax=Popillia japonica TaxID=7064 RepID=A0AAW1KEC1_POPJA
MYRQVKINESCTPFQRILWRNNTNEPIQTYELTTVTYGTTAAPYLSTKTLQQLAFMMKNTYPTGYSIIMRDFYVDDLLTGANETSQLDVIKHQVNQILASGKFELRKWASNKLEFCNDMYNSTVSNIVLDLDKSDVVSTLGLQWNVQFYC